MVEMVRLEERAQGSQTGTRVPKQRTDDGPVRDRWRRALAGGQWNPPIQYNGLIDSVAEGAVRGGVKK